MFEVARNTFEHTMNNCVDNIKETAKVELMKAENLSNYTVACISSFSIPTINMEMIAVKSNNDFPTWTTIQNILNSNDNDKLLFNIVNHANCEMKTPQEAIAEIQTNGNNYSQFGAPLSIWRTKNKNAVFFIFRTLNSIDINDVYHYTTHVFIHKDDWLNTQEF